MTESTPEKTKLEETKDSLERMQRFDVQSLVRTEGLGRSFDFRGAVKPALELVKLYQQLSVNTLDFLPDQYLEKVKAEANFHYNIFKDIINFYPESNKPHMERNRYLKKLKEASFSAFNTLHPLISYGRFRSVDLQSIQTDIQATKKSFKELLDGIKKKDKEGEDILQGLRNVAEEQGVSQHAIYFIRRS